MTTIRRATGGLIDMVSVVALVLLLPLVIVAVGAPIVLGVRLILEIIERL